MGDLKKQLKELEQEMLASIDERKMEDGLRKMDPDQRAALMRRWGIS